MNYSDPELLNELAAHYVLGTLGGSARLRFEEVLKTSAAGRDSVTYWESTLGQLGLCVAPVAPPVNARDATLEQAFTLRSPIPVIRPPAATPSPTRRRAIRERLQFAALACACGIAFMIAVLYFTGGRLIFSKPEPQIARAAGVLAVESSGPLPTYVAKIGIPASSMQWLISLSPDHRKLSITASDDFYTLGRGCIQLWWLGEDQAPKPLAILGTERDSTVMVDVPPGLDAGKTLVFAISIEPAGGSPTGKPTGPVLEQTSNGQDI